MNRIGDYVALDWLIAPEAPHPAAGNRFVCKLSVAAPAPCFQLQGPWFILLLLITGTSRSVALRAACFNDACRNHFLGCRSNWSSGGTGSIRSRWRARRQPLSSKSFQSAPCSGSAAPDGTARNQASARKDAGIRQSSTARSHGIRCTHCRTGRSGGLSSRGTWRNSASRPADLRIRSDRPSNSGSGRP